MLADGRGRDLRRIRSVVLLVCANDGSDFMLTGRRLLGSHCEPVKAAQARVLNQIVNARQDSDTSCRIPFHVFYGLEDRIVPVASARTVPHTAGAARRALSARSWAVSTQRC